MLGLCAGPPSGRDERETRERRRQEEATCGRKPLYSWAHVEGDRGRGSNSAVSSGLQTASFTQAGRPGVFD